MDVQFLKKKDDENYLFEVFFNRHTKREKKKDVSYNCKTNLLVSLDGSIIFYIYEKEIKEEILKILGDYYE